MQKRIFHSVSFGVGAFIVAFSLGSVLTMTTGIPLIGGVLNGIFTAMVLSASMLVIKYWGNATIMWVTFSILASFTTTLGPQGIYKVLIGLIAGLLWDSIYSVSKYKSWGLYAGGLIGSASIMFSLVLFLKLGFGKDAAVALDKYQSAFWMILGMNLVITLVGLYLGKIVYNSRLQHLEIFKNYNK